MARNNMGKNTDVATLLKARIMVSLTQCIPLPSASRFWAGGRAEERENGNEQCIKMKCPILEETAEF